MSTGENIRKIRKEKGLTQKELGSLSNIADTTIRRYELGLLNPKIETIRKIADALDVSIGELVDDWTSFPLEEIQNDFINDLEKSYYKELDKRDITLMYELIGMIFKQEGKYPVNLNDANGLDIFMNRDLTEYKNLSNEELKQIEKDLLTYLDFLLDKALKNKESKKTQ
jgi:Predicted transcriptional regulator with C-terminal CBS domains